MLEDESIQSLISWAQSGDVFCVFNPPEFSRVVLPQYFKHNNWQSFVRQLNMYGFHKVSDVRIGGPSVNDMFSGAAPSGPEAHSWEFRHPSFKRGRPDLITNIRRKPPKSAAAVASAGASPHQSIPTTPHEELASQHVRSGSQYSGSGYEQSLRQPPESSVRRAASPDSPFAFLRGGPGGGSGGIPQNDERKESVVLGQVSALQAQIDRLVEGFYASQAEVWASQERTFDVLSNVVSVLNEAGPEVEKDEDALARRRDSRMFSMLLFFPPHATYFAHALGPVCAVKMAQKTIDGLRSDLDNTRKRPRSLFGYGGDSSSRSNPEGSRGQRNHAYDPALDAGEQTSTASTYPSRPPTTLPPFSSFLADKSESSTLPPIQTQQAAHPEAATSPSASSVPVPPAKWGASGDAGLSLSETSAASRPSPPPVTSPRRKDRALLRNLNEGDREDDAVDGTADGNDGSANGHKRAVKRRKGNRT
jgi:hypothetical protein